MSVDLFRPYANMFPKMKHEASGFPETYHSEEDRQDYIRDYLNHEEFRWSIITSIRMRGSDSFQRYI